MARCPALPVAYQEHAFSDPRRFSVGVDGEAGHRNAMALVNLAWSHFFFWDARAMSWNAKHWNL